MSLVARSILIVETDFWVLDVLTLAITDEGYKVSGTTNFDKAIELFKSIKPDLVILEFKLNGVHAIQSCKAIKNLNSLLPILSMSCDLKVKQRYAEEGFDGFIPKPFDLDLLMPMINSFF